jgi:hypothetical protein
MSELRQRKAEPAPAEKPEVRQRKSEEPKPSASNASESKKKQTPFLRREWDWASVEAHEFFLPILDLVIPGFAKLGHHAKLEHITVRNPIYFICWLPTLLLLGIGKSLHALIGQGSDVRDDEKPAEKEARVAWIYMNDATYAFSALMDLWQLLVSRLEARCN